MFLPGGVYVVFEEDWTHADVLRWAVENCVEGIEKRTIGPGWYYAPSSPGRPALALAARLRQAEPPPKMMTPLWARPTSRR